MALAFAIAFWALVALLGILVVIAITPLHIEFRAVRAGALTFDATLRPFGGLGPKLSLSNGTGTRKKAGKARAKRPRKPSRARRFPQAAIRLLLDIIGRIRVHRASLNLRFGSGDPGETGQLFGMLTPLIYGFGGSSRAEIHVEPVFDEAILAARGVLDVSIIPATLLPPVLRFGWTVFGPAR